MMISAGQISQLIELRDGVLHWRWRAGCHPVFNAQFAGKPIRAQIDSNGYRAFRMRWGGRTHHFRAHRVIWCLHYGAWPRETIDHLNGIRDDNRIENLEDVSLSENVRRARPWRNRSRVGAYWHRRDKVWRVEFRHNGVRHYFGSFKDKQSALVARTAGELSLGIVRPRANGS